MGIFSHQPSHAYTVVIPLSYYFLYGQKTRYGFNLSFLLAKDSCFKAFGALRNVPFDSGSICLGHFKKTLTLSFEADQTADPQSAYKVLDILYSLRA